MANTKNLARSTGIIAFSTLLSRVLGFIRDVLIAAVFGADRRLDGFFVAWRIPNLFRRLVAEGALTISFIPVYTEYLETKSKKESLELAQKTFSILTAVLIFLVAGGIIFSPWIVKIFAIGFEDQNIIDFTVIMNRWLFPYLFLVGVVAFSMGYLNSNRVFFAPAFSPVLLNVGFIIGALVFTKFFEEPLYGLIAGVLTGGVMQLLLQVPYLIKNGFKLKISFDFQHPGIRRIFKMLGPAVFANAVYQLNILVSTAYASTCGSGSITYLYLCDRLTELILGIFIIAIGNVILPELSRYSVNGDFVSLRRMYSRSVSISLILALPAAVALIVIGFPIINVMFVRGQFSFADAQNTYKALKFGAVAVPLLAVLRITTPTFFSLKDTKTPLIAATASFIVNAVAGYFLKETYLSYAGLSLSVTISVFVQIIILSYFLHTKIGNFGFKKMITDIAKISISSAIMGITIYYLSVQINWEVNSFMYRLLYLAFIIVFGCFIYFISCLFLKVPEIKYVINTIKAKLIN